jgi:2-polyprenyl-3-methyl-5-hydroxy-6-metoxy-1,4-benzoquinol methylase
VPELNDPGVVAREYEDESRLVARRRAWSEFREGPSSDDAALDAVRRAAPRRVLEIGCGWGELAERIAETGAEVTAIDLSFRMAQLALERGVRALVADGQALPFDANRFDLVIANAVMYHIPDLDLALTEVGRVLSPDGVFIATTFELGRFSELWDLVGRLPPTLPFDAETAGTDLRRHFRTVTVEDGQHTLVFPSVKEVRSYLAATIAMSHLVDRVPDFEGPLRTARRFAVFTARTPIGS